MKLFVDYTNWKGVREWREIVPERGATDIRITFDKVPVGTDPLAIRYEHTFVINVSMPDRDNARRTLRVDHIHGFRTES